MIRLEPYGTYKLYIIYLENNIPQTGLTNLTVTGINRNTGNIVLPETQLQENISNPGEYFYMWNINNTAFLEQYINIYYKHNGEILYIEEFYFDITEDADAIAS